MFNVVSDSESSPINNVEMKDIEDCCNLSVDGNTRLIFSSVPVLSLLYLASENIGNMIYIFLTSSDSNSLPKCDPHAIQMKIKK